MLMTVARWLRESGVDAHVSGVTHSGASPADAVLTLRERDGVVSFAAVHRERAPYPNEIPGMARRLDSLRRAGHPLIVVPFMPEAVGQRLVAAGWSWADTSGNFDLRAPGLLLRQRRTDQAPEPVQRGMPLGSGSLAIVRALIRLGERVEEDGSATALAALANVSQPRASQVLARLTELELVTKTGRGRWRPDREALLDRFLAEYTGPGGSQQFLYSLDAPADVAVAIARTAGSDHTIAISADVGPDLLMAWRRPSLLVVYAREELDVDAVGLVHAQGSDDANVVVRNPADRSVYAVPGLSVELRGVAVPLADPSQMVWDLQDLGGADRLEAAGRMREWLLTSRP